MSLSYVMKNWVVGPFQCNCRLIVCPKTGEAALIDAGDEAQKILKNLSATTLPNGIPIQLKYLLHTHGHLDHIAATREVKESLKTPTIALHKADEPLYQQLQMQGRMFQLQYKDPLPVDHYLEDGEEMKIGEIKLQVIHNPGHSPGSVSMRLHENSGIGLKETVLTGDTLFQGSVGRTDLWGADQDTMFRSIKQRLLTLDDDNAFVQVMVPTRPLESKNARIHFSKYNAIILPSRKSIKRRSRRRARPRGKNYARKIRGSWRRNARDSDSCFYAGGDAGYGEGNHDRSELNGMGAQIILGNTYHLYLRPGHQRVERLGELHQVHELERPDSDR